MVEKRDYYEVLSVSKDASDSDLKKAFRSLARKHHPDKETDERKKEDAAAKFRKVYAAYEKLRPKGE